MSSLIERFFTVVRKQFHVWFKYILNAGARQLIVQILGFLSGIVIIRLLSKDEYAYYTLANTMLGTMTVLADGGIATAVTAAGGKVWQDKYKLGEVFYTGWSLKQKFAIGSFMLSAPILFYLLKRNGIENWMAILLLLALIPSFFSILSNSFFQIPLKLHQDLNVLQNNQILVGVLRVVLITSVVFFIPYSFIIILLTGLAQYYGNFKIKTKAKKFLLPSDTNPEVKKYIINRVKRTLPLAIYFCLSGQITVWMLSFFGSTDSVAQIGALGRFAMLLSLVTTLFNIIFVPRFSRQLNVREVLIKKYLLSLGVLCIPLILLMLTVLLIPGPILWLLGDKYSNLNTELFLLMAGSCINLLAGASYALYSNRGHIIHPVLGVIIGISGILLGLLIFKVNTLLGALYYNLFVAIYSFIANFGYGIYKLYSVKDRLHYES
ncbi:MAG: polysaccharide biosynthesis protein [Leeuwenhoekiella sp.]|nr:MAG: polysaccharide biosynthesis protein [Leeuwenhoekiella sp.]